MNLRLFVSLAALFSVPSFAATLRVGPAGQYPKPCAAFAAASDGDTIEIDAAGDYGGDVCTIYRSNLTIRGAGGRAKIDAAGRNAGGKAIWVISGNNTVVENIEFTGATVPDKNGAGIRQEGANLTIRNCYFHHNENGILTGASAASEILIEYSEFGHNGYGDGYSHNMYIGHVARFTLRFCYSHNSREGHLVKSRAAENFILYNRLTDEQTGTGSFELDLPNGGRSYVIGNIIQQGPESHNGRILNYRAEGPNPANPSTELYVINNTFVNERLAGSNIFINVDPGVATPAIIRNNIFVGPGVMVTQANAILSNNLTGADPRFMDPAGYNYRLQYGSPAIDAAGDPGAGEGVALAPSHAYVHPACGEGRRPLGAIDIGAFEFGGASFDAAAPDRCRKIDDGGVVNAANFLAGPVAPGSIFSIFGANLADGVHSAESIPLPAALGGTSVAVNGMPAPLFFASPSQLNAQMPFEVQPGVASVVVNAAGVMTGPAGVEVAPSAPALFTYGANHAVARNPDGSLNGPQNPVQTGAWVEAYLIGQGPVAPPVPTGEAAKADPLSWASLPYAATLGGLPARVMFLGLTPTLVGLLQADIEIPAPPSTGDYPLIITVGGASSRPALLSVRVP